MNPPAYTSTSGSVASTGNCAICMSAISGLGKTLPCLHDFCFVCIQTWTSTSAQCPLCRTVVSSILHNITSDANYEEYEVIFDDEGYNEDAPLQIPEEPGVNVSPQPPVHSTANSASNTALMRSHAQPRVLAPDNSSVFQPSTSSHASFSSGFAPYSQTPPVGASNLEATRVSRSAVITPTTSTGPRLHLSPSSRSVSQRLQTLFGITKLPGVPTEPPAYAQAEAHFGQANGYGQHRGALHGSYPAVLTAQDTSQIPTRLPFRATDRDVMEVLNSHVICSLCWVGWDEQLATLFPPPIVEPTKTLILNYIAIYGVEDVKLKVSLRCLLHDLTVPFVENMLFLIDRCTDPTRISMQAWTWHDTPIRLLSGPIKSPDGGSTSQDTSVSNIHRSPPGGSSTQPSSGRRPGRPKGVKRRLFVDDDTGVSTNESVFPVINAPIHHKNSKLAALPTGSTTDSNERLVVESPGASAEQPSTSGSSPSPSRRRGRKQGIARIEMLTKKVRRK
ncbi:transactivator [Cercopithecine alphaherpesvirus 9]|uniref:E3 ubiquitin-protein ligase IE61 n=1 Tax=Cercopithecine herpesvirus 9 (strain DHV) TaxID=36348 RepID=IE61_CHV9D|nr:ubiquitin E3 ligase ICP0 [Cercopithecine alphaherpesvirus 9]Q9E1W2.1 RecName: Full=E3 ubiquitin-protein ligase IE61; AltName: Full=Immediate-early protein 61; Short=IE61 [Cercopithecine herpesvirus 9 (strain DHV)]AAG27237.1 transactivator [Cercopithecine alphaherpesvirus 9]